MANSAYIKFQVDPKFGMQVTEKLKIFEQNVRDRIATKALKAAAKPILDAARAMAPRKTGALRASLGLVSKRYPSGVNVTLIGPVRGRILGLKRFKGSKAEPANYAHLVEFGTAPHTLAETAKGQGQQRTRNRDRLVEQAKAMGNTKTIHPGASPRPFMRPAWDANKAQVQPIMAKVIEEAMSQELNNAIR